jgi:endonuclease/exonuclease/phosphatase family metal-dependent hydrolase
MLRYKKLFLTIFSIILFIYCTAFILTFFVIGKRELVPPISKHPVLLPEEKFVSEWHNNSVVKILTLNIAHGRKNGVSQIFQSKEKIKSNLDEIVSLLQRVSPDIVALQEADGPSVWSGNFSHVAYIAEKAGYYYSVRGAHVEGLMLSYGTALLSKYHLVRPFAVTFKPSPPTFSKGFVSADININRESEIKVVSVHLDFLRKSVRKQQVKDMIDMLSVSRKSFIVMGDFNCELEKESALKILIEKLNLSAYKIGAESMFTFPKLKKRLDYILISQDLEYVSYKVVKERVSDHLGVIAEVRKKI